MAAKHTKWKIVDQFQLNEAHTQVALHKRLALPPATVLLRQWCLLRLSRRALGSIQATHTLQPIIPHLLKIVRTSLIHRAIPICTSWAFGSLFSYRLSHIPMYSHSPLILCSHPNPGSPELWLSPVLLTVTMSFQKGFVQLHLLHALHSSFLSLAQHQHIHLQRQNKTAGFYNTLWNLLIISPNYWRTSSSFIYLPGPGWLGDSCRHCHGQGNKTSAAFLGSVLHRWGHCELSFWLQWKQTEDWHYEGQAKEFSEFFWWTPSASASLQSQSAVATPIALFSILLYHQFEKRHGRGRHFPSSVSLQAARCSGWHSPAEGFWSLTQHPLLTWLSVSSHSVGCE